MHRFELPTWFQLLPALLIGAAVMAARNAPTGRWAVHLVATAVGIGVYCGVRCVSRQKVERYALPLLFASLTVVAATHWVQGLNGISPWYRSGVLRVHPSALVCPGAIVLCAALMRRHPHTALLTLLALQVVHIVQPDAGQASALGVGSMALVLVSGPARIRYWAIPHAVSIALAWQRFDPTPSVPFVEDIVLQAFMLGLVPALSALAALLFAVCSPFALTIRSTRAFAVQSALFLYFASLVLVSIFGEFPVPWLGFAPSPILGSFIGLALLTTCSKPMQQARSPPAKSSVIDSADHRVANEELFGSMPTAR